MVQRCSHRNNSKSIDGLSYLVEPLLAQNPVSGNLFVFVGRGRSKVKCLYWDRTGFALWYKRLERRRFPSPLARAQREEFFVGDTVGFTDKHLSERVGTIVRLNSKTASIAMTDSEGHWRVSYGLLRRIVDL